MQSKSELDQLDKSNYQVDPKEEKLYHARIEVKKFNSSTGERQSKPRIQKFGAKAFKVLRQTLQKQGFTVDILHDPTEHNAKLAEQKQQKVAATNEAKIAAAEARAILAAEEKEKERAALKAELMKEVLAELNKGAKDTKSTATNDPAPDKPVANSSADSSTKPSLALPKK